MTDTRTESYCLDYLQRTWRRAPAELRPPLLWIGRYEPIPSPNDPMHTPIMRAWLLSADGLEARPSSDLARFLTVHHERPWASGLGPTGSPVFGRTFEIGVAGFAPVLGTETALVEYTFGGCNGLGTLHGPNGAGQLEELQMVWIS